MEIPVAKKIRVFRSGEMILNILAEYEKSELSIKAFCIENDIAQASFHNWKKRYRKRTVRPGMQPGFRSSRLRRQRLPALLCLPK
jgi:hypothetical protein